MELEKEIPNLQITAADGDLFDLARTLAFSEIIWCSRAHNMVCFSKHSLPRLIFLQITDWGFECSDGFMKHVNNNTFHMVNRWHSGLQTGKKILLWMLHDMLMTDFKISGCNSDSARSCHQERLWKRNVKNPRKATGLGISTLPQMRTWCSELTITLPNYICLQIWLIIDIWGLVQLGHGYTWHLHRLFSSYIIKIENNYRSWWVYQQSTWCNSHPVIAGSFNYRSWWWQWWQCGIIIIIVVGARVEIHPTRRWCHPS